MMFGIFECATPPDGDPKQRGVTPRWVPGGKRGWSPAMLPRVCRHALRSRAALRASTSMAKDVAAGGRGFGSNRPCQWWAVLGMLSALAGCANSGAAPGGDNVGGAAGEAAQPSLDAGAPGAGGET